MKAVVSIALAAAAACRAPAHVVTEPPPSLVVDTDSGAVRGAPRDGGREFLGVPFAAPPTGALRFAPPAAMPRWPGVRDATARAHPCVQLDDGARRPDSDEDCLTLEVWVPPGAGADAAHLPVMVWIPGGAFIEGGGGFLLYDGAKLAARERVIVVALNYRVGPFGFLALPELAQHASLGLLDQQAALRWVQRNIAAFGGDPARVTIFGESAGAWSTCAQLALPSSRGLFARAIMESGACSDALYFDEAAAEAQGVALKRALGCADLACLRAKPTDAILTALPGRRGYILPPGAWYGPVMGAGELARSPLAMIRAGVGSAVPLLVGWNRDEGTLHTVRFDRVTPEELASYMADAFGPRAREVVATYAADPKAALTDITTDAVFACGARRIARAMAARGQPVYEYEFMHALDAPPAAHALGPTHSVELWFVFGTADQGVGTSPAEQPLVGTVMDAWGAFARGEPPLVAPGLPWPRYDPVRDELAVLDTTPSLAAHVKSAICDAWDAIERE